MDHALHSSSLEALFLDVIGDRESPAADVSSRLFRHFLEQGMDPLREVDARGRNLIEAWWQESGGRYGAGPLPEDVEAVAALHPEVWTHESAWASSHRHGIPSTPRVTLGGMVLDRFVTGGSVSHAALARWIRVLPLKDLTSFGSGAKAGRSLSKARSGDPADPLFRHALGLHRTSPETSAAVVDALFARGLPFRSPEVGMEMHTAAQWNRFLADGGDPDSLVPDPGKEGCVQPLWMFLRNRAPAETVEAIDGWALDNRRSSLAEEKDRIYWQQLDRAGQSASFQKAARSRPTWPSLVDPVGRTVLMCALSRSTAAFVALAKPARAWAPPANPAAEDRWGRGLWAYALGHDHLDSSIASVLLRNRVPLGPNSSGDGLLQQCLLRGSANKDDGRRFSQHDVARRSPPGWLSVLVKSVPREELSAALWGSAGAMEELGDWLRLDDDAYWGGRDGCSALIHLLASLVATAPPLDPPPSLRGALAWACFISNRVKDSSSCARALLDEGPANPVLLPERKELASKWVAAADMACLEGALIAATLPSVAPARPRPRM